MSDEAFKDILYEKANKIATITINRPEVYNAFTTNTLKELSLAFEDAERDHEIGVAVLTGAGEKAFCTGGDFREGKEGGYDRDNEYWHSKLHHSIRNISKPTIAAVNGYAIGGGHILHLICDITIAAETAVFGQAGPKVGSFDAGFGASYLARVVGEKKAREIWFLCRKYNAQEALEMGLINKVVPQNRLQEEVEEWCGEVLALSPYALKFTKKAFNADTDHQWGFEEMSVTAVRQFWGSEEAQEGKKAFGEKRTPDYSKFRK